MNENVIEIDEDALNEIVQAAIAVAADPPLKQGQYVTSALVYWPKLWRLRAAFDEAGIDWKARKC